MSTMKIISADSHIIEPPDIWKKWVPAKFQERVPKMGKDKLGGDGWIYDNGPTEPIGQSATAGKALEDINWFGYTYDTIVQGAFKGPPRIKEMDLDGVDAEVIYQPQRTMSYFMKQDREFQLAGIEGYNNWLAEDFCATDKKRLIGIAQMPNVGVDGMVAELQRARKKGHLGCVIATWPSGKPQLSQEDDKFWAAAQDMNIPVSIHVSLIGQLKMGNSDGSWKMAGSASKGMTAMPAAMGDMILSGVFDRFPKLQVIMVETGCGWIPYFMEQLDDRYWRNRKQTNCQIKRLPSEYWKSNWSATFIKDVYGLQNRATIGVENMLWSTDYPHAGNDWPYSRKTLKEMTAGIPDAEVDLIVAGNIKRLYNLGN